MKRNALVTMVMVVMSAAMLSACNPVTSATPGALGFTPYAPRSTSANLADQKLMAEMTRMSSGDQLDTYNTQVAQVNAQGTQLAVQATRDAMLATQVSEHQTQTPAAATLSAALTREALAMQATQDELARLNADATATMAAAQTRDALTLQAAQANATSTAQVAASKATDTARTNAVSTAAVAEQMTQIANQQAIATVEAALAAQAQAKRNAAWTWLWTAFMPWVVAVVVVIGVVFLWRWLKVQEIKQAMVARENGAGPLMIVQQRRPLSDYPADLPTLLRYLAWLMDTSSMSVVNPDRAPGPVVRLNSDGTADVPLVGGDPGAQERAVARQQSIELMTRQAEIAQRNLPVFAPSRMPLAVPPPVMTGEVIEGEVREVADAGEVKAWLDDVEMKLLEG